MAGETRISDRSAVTLLVLLASLLANVMLVSQLFVFRPEYVSELKRINARLGRIEARLWPEIEPPPPPDRGTASEAR